MALQPVDPSSTSERDPIADARALVGMAISLGSRVRNAHRLSQVTDRKAALYLSTLVRHASRLLQTTAAHEVPILRAGSNGPGGNVTHHVIRHDHMAGPPSAQRFLTVGSDARLRCCVVAEHDGSRLWADYDVSSAPDDLPLRVVLDALGTLISRLERAVTRLEAEQIAREAQLEADIAVTRARLSGMSDEGLAPRRHAKSEEPVPPWTRHVGGIFPAPSVPPAASSAAAPAASPAAAPAAPVPAPAVAPAEASTPAGPVPDVAIPTVAAETSESTPEAETDAPVAPIASAQAPPPDAAEAPKRVFKFSRLERAI